MNIIYCKQNNIFLKKVLTNTCILYYTIYVTNRGVEQLAARRAHNPKVVSSSLTPATKEYITRTVTVLVIFYCLKIGRNND